MSTSGTSIPHVSTETKEDKPCECSTKPKVVATPTRFNAEIIEPHTFQIDKHYYPRIVNAKLHVSLEEFMRLGNNRIAARYAQLHPGITKDEVLQILTTPTKLFRWAGADLFNVMDCKNNTRYMVVVETNSCPSGQKSMPMMTGQEDETNGYHTLMREVFAPWIKSSTAAGELPAGGLCVVYDKNPMEALGYASALSTVMEEEVLAVKHYATDADPPVRWDKEGCMHVRQVRDGNDVWVPVRAVFRYLTQKPWTRLPVRAKTLILNPIEACLAGGRNKLTAAHAYQRLNDTLPSGLRIRAPLTVMNVDKAEVGTWIDKMGGWAVVKVPYANAGQGVWTITNADERDEVVEMARKGTYEKYVVQALVGVREWQQDLPASMFTESERPSASRITVNAECGQCPRVSPLTHVGTMPDLKGDSYVCDVRMQVGSNEHGFRPLAVYARKALLPTSKARDTSGSVGKSHSWDVLGTNLSVKLGANAWDSDTKRLLAGTEREWGLVGVSMDDLVDSYVQTCLATTSIDACAVEIRDNGQEAIRSMCDDDVLLGETAWQW